MYLALRTTSAWYKLLAREHIYITNPLNKGCRYCMIVYQSSASCTYNRNIQFICFIIITVIVPIHVSSLCLETVSHSPSHSLSVRHDSQTNMGMLQYNPK